MSVPATYYLQYFNRQSRQPLQRQVQQIVDAPDQQFYAINQEEPLIGSNLGGAIDSGFAELLKSTGFTDQSKLELFTMGKDSLFMRVENIMDIFDTNGEVQYIKIKLNQLAHGLYTLVNGLDTNEDVLIHELSMSGNMNIEDMRNRRAHWKTVDDVTVGRKARATEDQWDEIELQSQRIRIFQVFYNMPTGEQAFLQ